MKNAISWFEIPTTQLDAAQAFYEATLGRAMRRENMGPSEGAVFPYDMEGDGTALFASMVIGQFENELKALVYLAILMPVVASIGGNSGTQALTVAVRSLASRELTSANAPRILGREVMVGLFNGVTIGSLLAVVAWVWFREPLLSLTIGLAVLINLVAASLAGTLVPLALDRLDRDPAVASPVFVTWITDTVGFLSFLGLAGVILL